MLFMCGEAALGYVTPTLPSDVSEGSQLCAPHIVGLEAVLYCKVVGMNGGSGRGHTKNGGRQSRADMAAQNLQKPENVCFVFCVRCSLGARSKTHNPFWSTGESRRYDFVDRTLICSPYVIRGDTFPIARACRGNLALNARSTTSTLASLSVCSAFRTHMIPAEVSTAQSRLQSRKPSHRRPYMSISVTRCV